jgi:hypothetical protein
VVLYRALLKAANSFADYNFRCYFVRRVRDDFWARATASDSAGDAMRSGYERLAQLRRMAALNAAYATRPVIVDPRYRHAAPPPTAPK